MKFSKIGIAMIVAGLVGSSGAFAGDTNTMAVTASVTGTCKFSSATSTLAFGALDPASTSDATAQVQPTYWCTKGTTAAVVAGNGDNYTTTRRMAGSGTASGDFIAYQLALTGGAQTGAGKGTALTLTVDGTVTNANYINATVGPYADSVALTITP